jgi:transcriptional regulator with XRE-family HTH domain
LDRTWDVEETLISGAQVRAARALLGWDVRELARRATVSIRTINDIEGSHGLTTISIKQLAAIRSTLEAAGIEFLGGFAPGLRLHSKVGERKW